MKIIHWFRRDLRIADNPALAAIANDADIIPIYIWDEQLEVKNFANARKTGGASSWWLHHSLKALNQELENTLSIYSGDPSAILLNLCQEHDIQYVSWNRLYEPEAIRRDTKIKRSLTEHGITVKSFNASVLIEPFKNLKKDATPFKVFTPFYNQHYAGRNFHSESTKSDPIFTKISKPHPYSCALDELSLLPTSAWDAEFYSHWQPGTEGAQNALDEFLKHGLSRYAEARDRPGLQGVSRLSPHLHFGEISVARIWASVSALADNEHSEQFKRELVWRDFAQHHLYHFPTLATENWNQKFSHFPWQKDDDYLRAWQQGQTGHPLVDAGMRELRQTGYMHNRIRMVCASFLVKNLLIDWREGERWFWDNLLDADLASNSASWQWVAGCGADAAPYFRIFNPSTQGEKFDKNGDYTRRFVPELAKLPDKYLFKPWIAPDSILEEAGITLGKDYPEPIVDLQLSRARALAALAEMKERL